MRRALRDDQSTCGRDGGFWIWIVIAGLTGVSFGAAEAHAAVPIAEWNDGGSSVELSGYARTISGMTRLGYDTGGLFPDSTGLNAELVRFEWTAYLGDSVVLELDNDLFWRVTSAGSDTAGFSSALGLAASREPERTVDLESTIVSPEETEGVVLRHDIDRLAATIYADFGDITVGRQGITWGKSVLFPVADLWSRFSPFELDTSQKPGIDAARVLFYPSLASEVDVVIADRGSLEDLSAGVRGAVTVGDVDLVVAGGKFWNELMAVAGAAWVLEKVKLRGEVVGPWNLDDGELGLPRGTAGLEYFSGDWLVGTEYHFNGTGADDSSGYLEQASSEVVARGESYFLGRHYAGVFTTYRGLQRLTASFTAIANLQDPSTILAPQLRYEISQNTTAGLGAFVSFGDSPTIALPPRLDSEFGAYGDFYFLELAAFF